MNVLLLGDCCGKTSFVKQLQRHYSERSRDCKTEVTIGFEMQEVQMINDVFFVWDSSSSLQLERNYLLPMVQKKGDYILVMFAIDSKHSYEMACAQIRWIRYIRGTDFPLLLVGNKSDLPHVISNIDIEILRREQNISYCEISAKEDVCTLFPFLWILHKMRAKKMLNNVK
jgi:GTPase SAR1 family protein